MGFRGIVAEAAGSRVMRWVMLVVVLGGCAGQVPAVAPEPVEMPLEALGQLGLMDYMFGPPPHHRIAPAIRCWEHCPDMARSAVP